MLRIGELEAEVLVRVELVAAHTTVRAGFRVVALPAIIDGRNVLRRGVVGLVCARNPFRHLNSVVTVEAISGNQVGAVIEFGAMQDLLLHGNGRHTPTSQR